jgi:3-oxo-5alpha-steroid 4-dehydrogenase
MQKTTEIRAAADVGNWDGEADVLVVGLGAAGACAAIEASDQGAEVLVLERAGGGGGTSANSGGLIYMGGGTPVQKAAGFDDTPEELFKFLVAVASPGADEEKIRLYSEGSVDHFHWLESLGIPFKRSFYPDPSMESAMDDCVVFSGGEDAAPWNEIARPAPRGHKPQTIGKAGPFLMQCILRAVEERPIRREFDVKIETLVQESDGRVVGVLGRKAGEARAFRARRGVILATGGFVFNEEMLARHVPQLIPTKVKTGTEFDDGRGIRMGHAAGGMLLRMGQAEVALPATIPSPLGRGILVNDRAQRFINEDTYLGHIGIEALFHQKGRAWLLLDEKTFMRNFFDQEPCVVGETIAEIESEAGFPAGVLQHTVDFYNHCAEKGSDPLFGKRQDFLVPLVNPPFALMDCCVDGEATYSGFTVGGLATGLSGEVLDSEGDEIPGLYAVGRTSALFCGQGYAASGISLGDGTFFGRRAGRAANFFFQASARP